MLCLVDKRSLNLEMYLSEPSVLQAPIDQRLKSKTGEGVFYKTPSSFSLIPVIKGEGCIMFYSRALAHGTLPEPHKKIKARH